MSSVLRSTDPILLETHIKDCLISLRDGATFSALIFGGLLLVSAAVGADIISMLPAFLLMFLLLIPFLPSLEQSPKVRHSLALFFLLGEGGIRARRVFAPIHDQNHDLYRHPAYDVCLCNWSRRTTW